jgi:hypothetical protein
VGVGTLVCFGSRCKPDGSEVFQAFKPRWGGAAAEGVSGETSGERGVVDGVGGGAERNGTSEAQPFQTLPPQRSRCFPDDLELSV